MLTSRTRRIIGVLVVLVVGLLFCGGNQTEAQDIIPASGNDSGISTIDQFTFNGFGVEVGTNQDPIEMSHDGTFGPWFKTLCFDQSPDRSFYYISQIIQVSGSDLWTGWYEEILTEDWIFVNDGTNNISVLVGGNVPPGLIIDLSEDGRSVSITFDPISPEGGPFVNINVPAVYVGALQFPPDDCIDTRAYPVAPSLEDRVSDLEKQYDELLQQHNELEAAFNSHTHSYLTGKGEGHNNTPADTGPPIPVDGQ